MTATAHTSTRFEELMSRESNGVHVSLIWNRDDNRISVYVFDASTDRSFEIDVNDARPLDVFNHPYAYAAFRRINVGQPVEQQSAQPIAA